ncbi:MAG: exodeoxyribonuclease VII small subunit [Gammaproteobacteria bacterium]|nr:exodeoxyribonuclease VII small subunit [Gammaproteobacteria bacterium]
MSSSNNNIKDFEKSLKQLESIVQQMENGELALEESLIKFEEGIKLAKSCQNALSSAELKVNQLIEKNGLQQTIAFDEPND